MERIKLIARKCYVFVRAGGVNARVPRMNSRPVMRNIAGSLWRVGLERWESTRRLSLQPVCPRPIGLPSPRSARGWRPIYLS